MGKVNTGEIITGIYKITNLINGKFYIGQSIDINYRFYEHIIGVGLNHNSAIDAAIKKYGKENFSYEILEKCDKADVFERERYWAETVYGGQCYAPLGYNIDRAGRGFHKVNWVSQYSLKGNKIKSYITVADASRELGVSAPAIRQAIKRKGICKESIWALGLADTIDPYMPPEYGIPIHCYDEYGTLKLSFKNGVEAAEYFNITTSAISSYVNHKHGYVKCCDYYLAKDGEDPIIKEKIKHTTNGKPCYEYSLYTRELIAEYRTIKDAANGRDPKPIKNALKGVQDIAYSSIWSYTKYDIIPEHYKEINKKYTERI
jgi:hypothetical protein